MENKSCLIIGAGGFVGKQLVEYALNNNFKVNCLLRNPDNFKLQHKNIKIIQGDVLDINTLTEAMKGVQIVFSAVGTKNFEEGVNDRTKAMEKIIEAAKKTAVKRIISVAGLGILNIAENKRLMDSDKFPKFLVPVSKDHLGSYQLLQNSDLDWTIFCPPQITSEVESGKYNIKIDYPPPGDIKEIGVCDLAKAIIDEASKNEFIKKRVGIIKSNQ